MNRRTAILLSMLMGGILPSGLMAQGTGKRTSSSRSGGKRGSGGSLKPVKSRDAETSEPIKEEQDDQEDQSIETPAGFPSEAGQQWRDYDISGYTSLDHSQTNPQNAIIEWIFKRTGTSPWHGDKIAVLNASRTQVKAYNNPKILEQVGEVVERFTNATTDYLTIRVRFVAAVDTRWRYAVYSRLTPVERGAQGQQIWTLDVQDSAFVLAQMQVYQGFRMLTEQKVEMVNGQTLTVKTSEKLGFTSGLQRENASGLGYQPKPDQLEEGVTLKLSPLLTFDGDTIDASIDLTATTIKSLHRTKVIAPRQIGAAEMSIDVPEVVESRLNQTVKNWPLGQTLLISAGIQPGILQNKGGFMNLRIPGTVPSGTELLIFLDAESGARPKRTASRDD